MDEVLSTTVSSTKSSSFRLNLGKDGEITSAQENKIKWNLQESCTSADMLQFQSRFESAPNNRLLPLEFRNALKEIIRFEYDDDEYASLFSKINSSNSGSIDWDEFISFLLIGYLINDIDNQRKTLTLPIIGLPRIQKSRHKHAICRICFSPDVKKDRTVNNMKGMYITASNDGTINWWTLDMNHLRKAYSKSPVLKVQSTCITDIACLSDVNILVTSSTERDLRFYDTTAKTFVLKIVISSWEYAISTMHYYFHRDLSSDSILILGDDNGNIRVILFSPVLRGPFQNKLGKAIINIKYEDLRHHKIPKMKLKVYKHMHESWVRQVAYYSSLQCFVSCAISQDAMVLHNITGSKNYKVFNVDKGIQCFAFDEAQRLIVTGGPDCLVRMWNPFVPSKPSVIFEGHHARIVHIVLQNNGDRIYSLASDKVIKVWDVPMQTCLQTYINIPTIVSDYNQMSIVYNSGTRELTIAGLKIATLILDEPLSKFHTDGFTHSKGISVVLYNPLFKIVLTCGMDSIIINWDHISGRRLSVIQEAHTRLLYGERIPVEITAATFDPTFHSLLTGARDGTMKIWNFNEGTCIRNLSIEEMMEVTAVFWSPGRILAVGWNRHITEFESDGVADAGKKWESRHRDDILCAAVRPRETIVTGSSGGDLIFWKLETGQPYRQFNCIDPLNKISITYNKRRTNIHSALEIVEKSRSMIIHAMIFLNTRVFHMDVGALLIALGNGKIQFWSDHPSGGYKNSFSAVHTTGDYVVSMTTDPSDMFLITGTVCGYIKIWLIKNYYNNDETNVNWPALRLQFPFLWKDRIEGQAKRSVRNQPEPALLSSYRAHLHSVTTVTYLPEYKYVLSGSTDRTVRLWTLKGEYLNTFGTFLSWNMNPSHPPDVKKVASFTTFKCWNSGYVSKYIPGKIDKSTEEQKINELSEPYLGKYFKLPNQPPMQEEIILDDSYTTIPCYTHLKTAPPARFVRPVTPELIKEIRSKKLLEIKERKIRFPSLTSNN